MGLAEFFCLAGGGGSRGGGARGNRAIVKQKFPFQPLHFQSGGIGWRTLVAAGSLPCIDPGQRVPLGSSLDVTSLAGGRLVKCWKDGVLAHAAKPIARVGRVWFAAVHDGVPERRLAAAQTLGNFVRPVKFVKQQPEASQRFLRKACLGEQSTGSRGNEFARTGLPGQEGFNGGTVNGWRKQTAPKKENGLAEASPFIV